jgi:hypothetical protein
MTLLYVTFRVEMCDYPSLAISIVRARLVVDLSWQYHIYFLSNGTASIAGILILV